MTACCTSCKEGKPCADRRGIVLVQTDTPGDHDIVVWGPMTAEVVSSSGHLVRTDEVERRLPMLLKRGSATLWHADDQVGRLLPMTKIDWQRVPEDKYLRAMLQEVEAEHGGLPSAVLTVTEPMAQVFPGLKPLVGERVPFLGTKVLGGDQFADGIIAQVKAHKLDSYSPNYRIRQEAPILVCDEARGCVQARDVKDFDMTSITFCSSKPILTERGKEEAAANHAAGFVIVQQTAHGTPLLQTGEDPIKRYVDIAGLKVGIEHPRGSVRTGKGPDGAEWSREMLHHYGRILDTKGPDGDMLDAYVGPNLDSTQVFVVDQVDKDNIFDEHKVLLGFDSLPEAVAGYQAHYPPDWKCGPVVSLTMDAFRSIMDTSLTNGPASRLIQTVLQQPINARGLEFESFGACVAWASKQPGIESPEAFCGSLSKEGEQTGPVGESRHPEKPSIGVNIEQAVPVMPEPVVATPAPKLAQQDTPPAAAPPSDDHMASMMARIEALEKACGEILARLGNNAAPEAVPQAVPTPPPAPAAAPAPAVPAITPEALAQTIEAAVERAVAKRVTATPVPAPVPVVPPPAPATPAAPGFITTPTPAGPSAALQQADGISDSVKRLHRGDPQALRELGNLL